MFRHLTLQEIDPRTSRSVVSMQTDLRVVLPIVMYARIGTPKKIKGSSNDSIHGA